MTEIRPLDIEAVLLVDEIVHGLAQRWAHTPAEALAHLDSETHGLTWRLVEAHYGGPIPESVRAAVRDLIDSHDPFFEAVRTANEHGPSAAVEREEAPAPVAQSLGPRCLRKGWTRDPRACWIVAIGCSLLAAALIWGTNK